MGISQSNKRLKIVTTSSTRSTQSTPSSRSVVLQFVPKDVLFIIIDLIIDDKRTFLSFWRTCKTLYYDKRLHPIGVKYKSDVFAEEIQNFVCNHHTCVLINSLGVQYTGRIYAFQTPDDRIFYKIFYKSANFHEQDYFEFYPNDMRKPTIFLKKLFSEKRVKKVVLGNFVVYQYHLYFHVVFSNRCAKWNNQHNSLM